MGHDKCGEEANASFSCHFRPVDAGSAAPRMFSAVQQRHHTPVQAVVQRQFTLPASTAEAVEAPVTTNAQVKPKEFIRIQSANLAARPWWPRSSDLQPRCQQQRLQELQLTCRGRMRTSSTMSCSSMIHEK